MKALYDIKEKLCKELDEIGRKGELSAGDLETLHKLTDTIKNIGKICKQEEERRYSQGNSYDGHSQGGNWMAAMRGNYDHGSSYHGNSFAGNSYGGYDGGNSQRGYARSGGQERTMREYMEGMLNEAGSEHERETIRRMMDKMRQSGLM